MADETPNFPVNAPVQDVADAVVGNRQIKHPEDDVGFCLECKNIMPEQYMLRNCFFQEGQSVPCKFCGGVTIITYRELVDEDFKARMDQIRGLGSTR